MTVRELAERLNHCSDKEATVKVHKVTTIGPDPSLFDIVDTREGYGVFYIRCDDEPLYPP